MLTSFKNTRCWNLNLHEYCFENTETFYHCFHNDPFQLFYNTLWCAFSLLAVGVPSNTINKRNILGGLNSGIYIIRWIQNIYKVKLNIIKLTDIFLIFLIFLLMSWNTLYLFYFHNFNTVVLWNISNNWNYFTIRHILIPFLSSSHISWMTNKIFKLILLIYSCLLRINHVVLPYGHHPSPIYFYIGIFSLGHVINFCFFSTNANAFLFCLYQMNVPVMISGHLKTPAQLKLPKSHDIENIT